MSVHRCPSNPALHVDMGAQYISKFKSKPSDTTAYKILKNDTFAELLQSRILQQFNGRIEGARDDIQSITEDSYIAPEGMNSVAKYFISQSRATVVYQHQLRAIDVRDNLACCQTACGKTDSFDAVVLTMPVPQILALQGNALDNLESHTRRNMEAVTYSSRYALGLFYKESSPSFEWIMKYFDHPIIRFVRREVFKREPEMDSTLLVHTSVPFAVENLESDKSHVEEVVMAALKELLPSLPQPHHIHLIRWRFSQVRETYLNCPGFVELCKEPLVLAAGDGFVGSNFESCLSSAHNTTQALLNYTSLS